MSAFSEDRLTAILSRHGANQINVAVETGVWHASTTRKLTQFFQVVHGIELSEHFFGVARKNCAGFTGITLHLGDSAVVLPSLVAQIPEPALFYLDAHWWGSDNVADSAPFPLWDELACLKDRPYPDLIVVDDAHTFGKPVGHVREWTNVSIDTIVEALGAGTIIEAEQIYDWGVVWRRDVQCPAP